MAAMAMSEFRHNNNDYFFFHCTPGLTDDCCPGKVYVSIVNQWLSLSTFVPIGCPGGQEAKFNVQRIIWL